MEHSPAILHAKELLFLLGMILGVGMLTGFIARLLKVPDVVMFLLAGMALGSAGLGIIDVKVDSTLNQLLLIFGSCYILFDGGASVRLNVLKGVWPTLVSLSTFGVLISAVVTAFAAQYFLHLPFIFAMLLGAVIASTDPATLVPVFRQVKIRAKVAQTVMSESAFNDAMGAILTFAVLGVAVSGGSFSISQNLLSLLQQSLLGVLGGAILGYLAAMFIAHEKYSFLAEYAPIVTIMSVAAAYLSVDNLHASGFMAVFVFGMVLGNKDLLGFKMEENEESKLEDFILTTSLIMRIFIFVLLGSQVNFALLQQYFWPALAVVIVFMLVARPLAVFACALPDRRAKWTAQELLFMCWTRETGVIPGALAGILVGMKVQYSDVIASVTFMAILLTILLQATTTKWLAAKLDLLEE
ncbi:cation:proton antiporter [Methylotenera versatilis]|uniref:Sodium/hydrogen exchanger n=1 Tax=Methylotenera versatilis (strain 301) TaxID=666681 RepID=D7DL68_METV0|nr:cation:proton antiporter [Methylotenera versatilis]ADI30539.1 sodium/hydrogen exchanger [Methylotenera versatilis 301]